MNDNKKPHGNAGRKQSPEHIAKRVAAYTGKSLSDEHREKLAAIERTPEWREKTRQGRLKQTNAAFGNPGEPNLRAKTWWAELRTDPIRLDAYLTKLRARKVWNKGISMREESKKKLSTFFKGRSNAALVGRRYSTEHRRKLSVTHMGIKQSEESKLKKSLALKGRVLTPFESRRRGPAHHFWGKPPPHHRIGGHFKSSVCAKGHMVRSSWERGIADWLYLMGVEYDYEPRIFDLGDGIRYRPDFYIPQADLWLEVKGYLMERDEEKFRRFTALGHRLFIIGKREWKLFEVAGVIQIPGLKLAS